MQSIKDPEDIGHDVKGIGKRIGFFFSGLVYLGLGFFSIYEIFWYASKGNSHSSMISTAYLPHLFYAIATSFAIQSMAQFITAYQGDFLSKFHLADMSNKKTRSAIQGLGYAGLVSRGILAGIVAYFFFRAAITTYTGDLKGTADAFLFLRQNSEGPWLMGLVAFGLICYGAYLLIIAKYRKFYD